MNSVIDCLRTDVYYCTQFFLLLSLRFNVSEAAKYAIAVEAERVEK
jgi:hypothetical protein